MIQARQQASGLQNICLTHILPSAMQRHSVEEAAKGGGFRVSRTRVLDFWVGIDYKNATCYAALNALRQTILKGGQTV